MSQQQLVQQVYDEISVIDLSKLNSRENMFKILGEYDKKIQQSFEVQNNEKNEKFETFLELPCSNQDQQIYYQNKLLGFDPKTVDQDLQQLYDDIQNLDVSKANLSETMFKKIEDHQKKIQNLETPTQQIQQIEIRKPKSQLQSDIIQSNIPNQFETKIKSQLTTNNDMYQQFMNQTRIDQQKPQLPPQVELSSKELAEKFVRIPQNYRHTNANSNLYQLEAWHKTDFIDVPIQKENHIEPTFPILKPISEDSQDTIVLPKQFSLIIYSQKMREEKQQNLIQ